MFFFANVLKTASRISGVTVFLSNDMLQLDAKMFS